MMKLLIISVSLFLLFGAVFGTANAEQLKQQELLEIIKKAYKACYYQGDDGCRKARMIIVDKNNNKQLRQFDVFRKDKQDAGDQDFLVHFERPSDVRGTVFLVNKHIDSDDDRWIYLPGLDLEKRISASDKRTSFVGSNYFYEDISGRNYQLDDYQLIEQTDTHYFIKAIPKDKTQVEFEHYTMKIAKDNFMPWEVIYYKANDKAYRKVEILKVKDVAGYPTVFESKVSNLETGGYTLMQSRVPAYDQGLEQSIFTLRSLRNPPKNLGK